jgi:hypothetical protein
VVEQNVAENHGSPIQAKPPRSLRSTTPAKRKGGGGRRAGAGEDGRIHFTPLDWETDKVTPALLASVGETARKSFDAVIACDCVYNEALIEPFVSTCVDVCGLRTGEADGDGQGGAEPCVCVVAQQLRDPLVFEAWLTRFAGSFHTWRVPDEWLLEGLRSNSGFVVHVGVLKDAVDLQAIQGLAS